MSRWLFFPSQKCGWNFWDKIKQKNFPRDSKVIEKTLFFSNSKKIKTFSRHALNVKILLHFNFTEGKFKIWSGMFRKFSTWNSQTCAVLLHSDAVWDFFEFFSQNFNNKTRWTLLTCNLKFTQIIFIALLTKRVLEFTWFLREKEWIKLIRVVKKESRKKQEVANFMNVIRSLNV